MESQEDSDAQAFLPRKACERCHIQKLRCDSREGSCGRCSKAGIKCIRGPSLRRQRLPRSRRQASKMDLRQQSESGREGSLYSDTPSPQEEFSSMMDFNNLQSPQLLPSVEQPFDAELASSGTNWIVPTGDFTNIGLEMPFSTSTKQGFHVATTSGERPAPLWAPMRPHDQQRSRSVPDSEVLGHQHLALAPSISLPQAARPSERDIFRELTDLSYHLHDNAAAMAQTSAVQRSQPSVSGRISSHKQPIRSYATLVAKSIRDTFAISKNFIELLWGISTPHAAHSTILPSPLDHAMEARRFSHAASEGAAQPVSAFRTQASVMLLLSCYLCILETFEDILTALDAEIEQSSGFNTVRQLTSPTGADAGRIPSSMVEIHEVLRTAQSILHDVRESIRASSSILDSDHEARGRGLAASGDVTRPAVLAVQVRDVNLANAMNRLQQSMLVKFGME